jgi:menaquinone-dependent protoporphyrinogen IX oxidase
LDRWQGIMRAEFNVSSANDVGEDRTLIAYATKGGTTKEYANAIAAVLRDEFKMQVDLVNLGRNHNPDLAQYRNVIVGSGVKIQKMHGDGRKFLEKDFGDRKVAIFLSSLEPKDEAIKKYVDTILEKNTKLKPFGVEVFGGRMRFLGKTSHDQRDISKAREWAQNIAIQIKA